MTEPTQSQGDIETIVVPRTSDLGDGFEVRRALPSRQRRMVGPFVFLDQMGPHVFNAGTGLDVRPHPHIGLATVTYLFEGEIHHRDSLGTSVAIRPGEVNWMTAGRGIVHSERTAPEQRQRRSILSGLQCWVALPRKYEETEPDFLHVGAEGLPVFDGDGVRACVIAGSFHGVSSPVPVLSPLFYVDLQLAPNAAIAVPAEYQERAAYVVSGSVKVGQEGSYDAGQLLVLRAGSTVDLRAGDAPVRLMLLGGEPMDGPRAILWNFVSSSADRLEQAKEDWRKGRFPQVPGEHEFIPLPELAGQPVFYP
jgi:redox-sensitive bicupin YhaK (pirin superfamily)